MWSHWKLCVCSESIYNMKRISRSLIGESKVLQKALIIDYKLGGEINFGKWKVRHLENNIYEYI